MQTLKQFLSERNEQMKARYNSLIGKKTQKDAIDEIASEYKLSWETVYSIVARSNKNRAN